MAVDRELIYVGDPMCSWCYGFAPAKTKLEDQCRGRAAVTFVAGGLHIDWTEPQDRQRIDFLREHWEEIGERTGQPFKFDILERTDFVYNTEAACRAAVTARMMEGNGAALEFFTRLQSAFYAENRDVTQEGVLIGSDEMKAETMGDFQFAQRMGVTGFPTVVVNDRTGYAYLTVGWQPYEQLEPIVEAWLTDRLDRQRQAAE